MIKHRWWHRGRRQVTLPGLRLAVVCDECEKTLHVFEPTSHCSRCGVIIPKNYSGSMCRWCLDLRASIGDR